MNVGEMTKLPRRAGAAKLKWFTRTDRLPSREGATIRLPRRRGKAEFYTLKGGRQFLYSMGDVDPTKPDPGPIDWVYFGGTDEAPFFTSLRPQGLLAFQNGGERAFFEALKPSLLRRLEPIYGEDKTLRQGDLYAFPMPYGWDHLFNRWQGNSSGSCFQITRRYGSRSQGGVRLFGTRHRLSGRVFEGEFWIDGIGRLHANSNGPITEDSPTVVLADGDLGGPDHRDLSLKGLHVIMRAPLLPIPYDEEGE